MYILKKMSISKINTRYLLPINALFFKEMVHGEKPVSCSVCGKVKDLLVYLLFCTIKLISFFNTYIFIQMITNFLLTS